MKLTKDVMIKLSLLCAGGILFYWLLKNYSIVGTILSTIWGLIFPFVLGFIIAFLLNIPMRAIETRLLKRYTGRHKRVFSFILTILLVLAIIALVILLVLPQLWQTVEVLAASMPAYLTRFKVAIEPYLEYVPQIQEWVESLNINWNNINWGNLISQVTGMLQSGVPNFLTSAVGVATSVVNGFVAFFIGIIFTCYLLLDKEHLVAQLKGMLQAYLPAKRYARLHEIALLTGETYSKFVAGQCIEAVIVTVMYALTLTVGGFDYALLISVAVGITSLIPMIGAFLGAFIGAFLLLVSMGFWRTLAFVIICIVLQQIEGNLIYPHVVGSSVGLPALWILVATMVGGGLGGIFGMLFFIPLTSVVYTLVHRDASARLAAKGIPSPVSELPKKPPKGWRRRQKKNKPSGDGNTPDGK